MPDPPAVRGFEGAAGQLVPGARLGDHELHRLLGRGGMGEVWEAVHLPTGARRALKLLRLAGPAELARFQREAEALARLAAHPHLVRVHAFGVEGGGAWLSMDLVPGGSLAERLRQGGPLPPAEAARVMGGLARGLAHAHARGVLHRDLKPENVLLDENGAPRLADFGVARLTGAGSLTATGEVLGTPAYMAPEQARGEPVDERVDVFGLGAVLYHALTGEPPYRGKTVVEILGQVLAAEPVPPRARRAEVPPWLEAVCRRAMARDPNERFPSVTALVDALESGLEGRAAWRRWPLLVAGLAGGLLALAGLPLLLPVETRPAAGGALPAAAPAPPPGSDPGPRPAPAAPATWLERLQREERAPVPRPGPTIRTWRPGLRDIKEALEQGRTLSTEAREQLRLGAAAADPDAQTWLGIDLLQAGRPSPADRERGRELLFLATRPPEGSLRARLELARSLAPEEPAAARWLLAVEPAAGDQWHATSAACAWLALGEPGDLGQALRRLGREHGVSDLRTRLARHPDPLAPVLLGVATYEGWGGDDDEAEGLRAMGELLAADRELPDASRAALAATRWLAHAAAVGEPAARSVLAQAREPVPDPATLDPRDLIAFDGSRAVRRPAGLEGLAGERPQREAAQAAGDLRRLEELARAGGALSQWALSRALSASDPRQATLWCVLAALRGPHAAGHPPARVIAGRRLLQGEGCPPWPEEGARWLEDELDAPGEPRTCEGITAQLWLGVARFAGPDRPASVVQGLEQVEAALDAARAWDAQDASRQLTRSLGDDLTRGDRFARWLAPFAGARPAGYLGKLAQDAVRGQAEPRTILEALTGSNPRKGVARRACYWLAQLHLPHDPAAARALLERSSALGYDRAERQLERLAQGELTPIIPAFGAMDERE